uniref:Uncharacterized protein n=1 Tax=Panagrolaimus sp. JU765 TaxID=591449 RepID=A0AC34RS13_9BILA
MNAIIQRHTEKREMIIDELIFSLYYLAGVFHNEIARGYYEDGSYVLEEEFVEELKGGRVDVRIFKCFMKSKYHAFASKTVASTGKK